MSVPDGVITRKVETETGKGSKGTRSWEKGEGERPLQSPLLWQRCHQSADWVITMSITGRSKQKGHPWGGRGQSKRVKKRRMVGARDRQRSRANRYNFWSVFSFNQLDKWMKETCPKRLTTQKKQKTKREMEWPWVLPRRATEGGGTEWWGLEGKEDR